MPRNPYAEDYEAQEAFTQEEIQRTRRVNRDANRMVETAHNPTVVRDMFDFGTLYKKRGPDMTPLNPWDGSDTDPNDFVRNVEQAFLANRGNVPYAWLVAQDPEDVGLLHPDVANEIFQLQEDALAQKQFESEVAAATDERIRSKARLRNLVHSTANQVVRTRDVTQDYGTSTLDLSVVTAEERTKIEEDVRNEMLGTGVVSDEIAAQRSWTDAIFGVAGMVWGADKTVATGIGWLGKAMEGAIQGALQFTGIGPTWQAAHDANLFGMQDRWRDEQQALIEAAEADAGLPTEALVQRLRGQTYQAAFQTLQKEDPESFQGLLDMAGGDQALAFGFLSDMMDNDVTVQEQMRQLVEDPEAGYRKDLKEFTDTLEENDFRVGDAVLDALSIYKFPYQLATSVSLLLTDGDVRTKALDEGFSTLWEEVAKNDNSPANVLGLENTAVGMLLDLGAGIAFDPTTWLLGPRLYGMMGRAASKVGVTRLLRSPFVVRNMDDAARVAFSDAHGISQAVQNLGWLDDTGDLGAALEVLGGVDQTLPGAPWLRSDARAVYAENMSVGSVVQALDPDDLARLGSLQVDNLAKSVQANGFQGVLELTYSVQDNTLHMTDGLKRLRAAQDLNLRNVPVTIRMTDTLKRVTQTAARQLHPDDAMVRAMSQIREGSQSFAYHFSDDLTPEAAQAIVDGSERFRAGGITTDRAKGLATQATGGDPIMLIFDQAQMSPDLLTALRSGDITDIRRVRAQNPTPVGWVRLSEFDELADASRGVVATGQPAEFGTAITRTEGPAGVLLQSLHGEGTLPQLPTSMADVTPNVGANSYRKPSTVLPREFVLGQDQVTARAALEKIVERALNNGATPASVYRLPGARAWNSQLRQQLANNPVGKWLDRYMGPQHTITRFEYHGPHAAKKITESIMRIWGDDTAKIDLYLQQVYDWQRRVASGTRSYLDDLARLQPDLVELKALQDLHGGGWDDSMRFLEDQLEPGPTVPGIDDAYVQSPEAATLQATRTAEWEQAKANRAQINEEVFNRTRELDKKLAQIDAVRANSLPDSRELGNILQNMWDDFNRTRIAPTWAKHKRPDGKPWVNPDTGMVPWEDLRRGRQGIAKPHEGERVFLPEELQAIAKDLGIPAEQLSGQLVDVLHQQMAFNAPLSPLDLVVAAEKGGAAYIRFTQGANAGAVREGLWTAQRLWITDKVMQPAVAMTVSFDELLRFFHIGGAPALGRWMRARADFVSARVAALTRHGRVRQGVSHGSQHLSKAAQERVRVVNDFSVQFNQAERQVSDTIGQGWDDIMPGEPGYLDAARRWTGDMLQSTSFRAYLKGPDAFQQWFLGPDGLQLRQATVLRNGSTGLLASWEDAYKGWQTLFERVILAPARKAGRFDDVMQAFRDTARKIEEAGGRPQDVPDMVFAHMGPVRGVRKHDPNVGALNRMTQGFFDTTFGNPVNFRRGVLADLARATEKKRLTRLYTDQGRRIVSEAELENMLSVQGLSGSRIGMQNLRNQRALELGVVPESYIDELADMRAIDEVDNLMYTWDQGRRIGSQSRAVFPFGRPWADMAGFWGREVMTRPAARGWLARSNTINSMIDNMPFNPKPLALVSRLAQTDLSIEELWPGQELPFGAESADFSPFLFLPTDGENPIGSLIPGIGFIPLAFMDTLLTTLHDPVDNPLEYQNLVENVAQIIPSAAYTRGGFLSDLLGGGVSGRTAGILTDLAGAVTGRSFFNSATTFGDISRETAATRALSTLLADPEVLSDLLAITDPRMLEIQLQGIMLQAAQNAARGHIGESVTRALTPIRAEYDPTVGEIQDVWLNASQRWPDYLQPIREYDLNTPDGKRQAANDVRNQFFDLPQWKRDLYVAEYPALAVNLVGGWEWTDKAADDLGFDVTASYRTGGTNADLARHQLYVDRGYVRPLNMLVRSERILALMQASRNSAAKRMYEFTAERINEVIWNTRVSPSTMSSLQAVVDSEFGREFGYTTARELWAAWGSAEGDLERWMARRAGISEDSEDFVSLTERVAVPTKERGWGRTFPGTDETEVSARFNEVTINTFTPEVQEIADGLGIELTPGMTGEQFYRGIQEEMTDLTTPLWGMVESTYDTYVNERSVEGTAALDTLRLVTRNPNLSPEYRDQANAFFSFIHNLENRLSGNQEQPRPSLAESEEVARRYSLLRANGEGLPVDWEGAWEKRFQRRYGPLEWTPPVPAPVFREDGSQNPNAYQPYIQRVIDGDTITVSTTMGAPNLAGRPQRDARPRMHDVRLLGILAPERFGTGGPAAKAQLEDALMDALRNGDRIWLVRDSETFGSNTDAYGRELAWLWIGDTPYQDPSSLRRDVTPSGPLGGEE